ncbi:MAG TPA: hypothetical protein VK843_15930 [Planctomycetota bacterium]|nr:hypothetical protein [Planctomycetota bacterium]
MKILVFAAWTLALSPNDLPQAGDVDSDRDGLSDFAEVHKYFTDPKKADSDGDGLSDGDWNERREYSYSVRAVIDLMAPFDVASMNDDYQDVRVLEQRPDLLEFEVVVYPFNTVSEAIAPDKGWRKPAQESKEFLAPGVCCNWDKPMQAQLLEELKAAGIDLAKLDDVEAASKVSKWLLERASYEDGFTTFCVGFDRGAPKVDPLQQSSVDETLKKSGRTLSEQWERELFGAGMFANKTRGSCTSSAIYLSTGLKAAGIPTRTVVCVPVVDSSDDREVAWINSRISHKAVRRILAKSAAEQRGSWTSHTFNEVFVGDRWRRLNYSKLGQNVLDAEFLGLMVHVHTFKDHGEAGLVGWGNRLAHPMHDALFGGPNPYSCVSLSDCFGAHSKIANEPLTSLRELTISKLYWFDDPHKDPVVTMKLDEPEGAGHLLAHVDGDFPKEGKSAYSEFYAGVEKSFVLRAFGQRDIPVTATRGFWLDSNKDMKEFYLRIEPADFAAIVKGVEYELSWLGKGEDFKWKVRPATTIRYGVR